MWKLYRNYVGLAIPFFESRIRQAIIAGTLVADYLSESGYVEPKNGPLCTLIAELVAIGIISVAFDEKLAHAPLLDLDPFESDRISNLTGRAQAINTLLSYASIADSLDLMLGSIEGLKGVQKRVSEEEVNSDDYYQQVKRLAPKLAHMVCDAFALK